MKAPEIGTNAGKIWQALDKKGELDLTGLKNAAKLDSNSVLIALGWLAREDKILFYDSDGKMKITLVY